MAHALMKCPNGELFTINGTPDYVAQTVATAQARGTGQMIECDSPDVAPLVRRFQPRPAYGLPLLTVNTHVEEPMPMPTMNFGQEAPTINVPPPAAQPAAGIGGEEPLVMPTMNFGTNAGAARHAAPAAPVANAAPAPDAGCEGPLVMPQMVF